MEYSDSKELGGELNKQINKRGFVWISLFIALILFAVGSIPYLMAIAQEDAQHSFHGYMHYPEDMDTYASFIKQSASGSFVFYNPYETQSMEPAYFNLLWLILGKISALGFSFAVVFQMLRIISAIVLIFAFSLLTEKLNFTKPARIFACCLFVFGSGFGWIAKYAEMKIVPPDLYTELFPFVQASFVPHSALAHGVLLLALGLVWLSEKNESTRHAAWAGLLLLVLGFFRSYDALVGWSVGAVVLAVQMLIARNRFAVLKRSAIILSLPLVAFLYSWWLTSYSEGFSIWSQTNKYSPPDIQTFLFGLGLPLVGTIIWLVIRLFKIKQTGFNERFLFAWIATLWFLMLSGVLPFAWRTCAGFTAPMLLATVSLIPMRKKLTIRELAIYIIILCLALPGSVVFINQKINEANEQYRYYFQAPEVIDALKWLDTRKPGTKVFTHGHIALKVPAYSNCVSYLGHKDLSRDFLKKKQTYMAVIKSKSPRRAKNILKAQGVDLVFWGPLDRRFAKNFTPDKVPNLVAVYKNPLVTVYQFVED